MNATKIANCNQNPYWLLLINCTPLEMQPLIFICLWFIVCILTNTLQILYGHGHTHTHISNDIEFECESIEFMFHCQSQFNLAYCSFHYTVNMQPDAKYSMQQYFFKIESVVFLLHSIWLTVIETEFENIFLLTLEWCKAINSLSIAYRFSSRRASFEMEQSHSMIFASLTQIQKRERAVYDVDIQHIVSVIRKIIVRLNEPFLASIALKKINSQIQINQSLKLVENVNLFDS